MLYTVLPSNILPRGLVGMGSPNSRYISESIPRYWWYEEVCLRESKGVTELGALALEVHHGACFRVRQSR